MSEPNWGPIGQEVFERTYSRIQTDGSTESWADTCKRVAYSNAALCPSTPSHREVEQLFDAMYNFKLLPAGRHLWLSGVNERQYLFNCHHAGWPAKEHFTFTFEHLLRGGGVGSNYSDVVGYATPREFNVYIGSGGWLVEDSAEGWVDAFAYLLDIFDSPFDEVYFDLSQLRAAGEALKTVGGVSAGAQPLADLIVGTAKVFSESTANQFPNWEDAMKIDHLIASAVVAGNIRRSARMSIMDWDAPGIWDFLECKRDASEHWTTNISIGVNRDFFRKVNDGHGGANAVLDGIVAGMLYNGEPGIYNFEKASQGEHKTLTATNPCGEIPLEEFENCNLVHVNLALCKNATEARHLFSLAARFAYRATFTPDVSEVQRAVLLRNRRLGVGFYGLQAWGITQYGIRYSQLAYHELFAKHLREFHATVKAAADNLATECGTAKPIKYTAIAPTGTISLLSGETFGISPVFAKHYKRRMRYALNDPLLARYPDYELDAMSSNTGVVTQEVRDRILERVAEPLHHLIEESNEISMGTSFGVQLCVQQQYADNAVSNTIAAPSGDPDELRQLLREYGPHLKGVTVFPEKEYKQAPIERIHEPLTCQTGGCGA